MDKYNQFLNLLHKEGDYPHENYVKVLQSLASTPQAYVFFYENLPQEIKGYIIENKRYYAEQFFYVIQNLDNKTFNEYFFKENFLDLSKSIAIENIRLIATNKLDNKELQEFVRDQDKPKSLDKVIESLSQLYTRDKVRYEEVKEQYRNDLLKINKISSEKSRTIKYLEHWVSYIANQENLEQALKLMEDLGINFELVFNENKKRINLHTVKKEDLAGFDRLFSRNPEKNRYDLIRKYIACGFYNPLSMLETIEKKSPEHFVKYWEIFEEFLFLQKENNGLFKMTLQNKEKQWGKEINTGPDLFIAYFSDDKFQKIHSIYSMSNEEDARKIMKKIEIKLLHYKLNNDVENKVQKPKLKI